MIYFVLCKEANAVKIGYVEDKENIQATLHRFKKRLSQIQNGNPYKLDVYGLVEGNYSKEQSMHKDLNQWRLEGEWFTCSNEVYDVINKGSSSDLQKKYSSLDKAATNSLRKGFKEAWAVYTYCVAMGQDTKALETLYPWFPDVYVKLGERAVRQLGYSKRKVLAELAKYSNGTKTDHVRKELNLCVGKRYSNEELKIRFTKLSKDIVGVENTASAVSSYYKAKPTEWKEEGKRIKGYIIKGV